MRVFGVNEGEIFNPAISLPDLDLLGKTWIVVEAISDKDALHQANLWDRGEHPLQIKLKYAYKEISNSVHIDDAQELIFDCLFPFRQHSGNIVIEVEARDFTVFTGSERLFKPRYWAAEIVGLHPKFKFNRQFLKGTIDFSRANKKASRGVFIYYTLSPGKIYEVSHPVSNKNTDRYFCRVVNNEVVRMTVEEVTDWLNED